MTTFEPPNLYYLAQDLAKHELKAAYEFEKGALKRWLEEVDTQTLPEHQKRNRKTNIISRATKRNFTTIRGTSPILFT